jgi:hypothetical protein
MAKPVPYAPESERAVIGSMVYWAETRSELLGLVAVEDFHDPRNAAAFEHLEASHWSGQPISEATLVAHLAERGYEVDAQWRADVMVLGNDPAWRRHAETLARHHARRLLQDAMATELAGLGTDDPFAVMGRLRARFDRIDQPADEVPDDCLAFDDLMALDIDKFDPWIIPGLMRRWRILVVSGEGWGKSTLLRQFALCAAAGTHPLDLTTIEPVRTLLVDLEVPAVTIQDDLRWWVNRLEGLDRARVKVWAREGGVDLRNRRDRRHFESILAGHRPALVCLGPLYKSFKRHGTESDEEAAIAYVEILDDLRVRYNFGLLMEHHPPHGYGGARDMRPFGSVVWQRWPDLGLGLVRAKKDEWHPLKVTRFRGDRVRNEWPRQLDKGMNVPWVGNTGKDDDQQGRF